MIVDVLTCLSIIFHLSQHRPTVLFTVLSKIYEDENNRARVSAARGNRTHAARFEVQPKIHISINIYKLPLRKCFFKALI